MRRHVLLCATCLALASCGYGPAVGPPPGPVPHRSREGGPPPPAGELAPVTGHGAQRVIAAGVYRGDLVVEGNGNLVQGAGIDRTVVRGNLRIRGDANVVHSLRILGESSIEGEENDVRGVAFGEPDGPVRPEAATADGGPPAAAGAEPDGETRVPATE
ncbi:MAG: hypothetical protein GYA57_02125 [Myxococcales bacterium]|nr:hypothetical protein [Myxococcales bacterium]